VKKIHILAPGAQSVDELGSSNLASHRLRLAVAAKGFRDSGECSVLVGDQLTEMPDALLVGKIGAQQIEARAPLWLKAMQEVRNAGGRVILDYTDNHLGHQSVMTAFYSQAVSIAQRIVVPSEGMRAVLPNSLQTRVTVIPDALEYEPVPPRQTSTKIGVWFGHGSNVPYLLDYFRQNGVAHYFDSLIICTDSTTLAAISRSHALKYMPPVRGIVWSVENQRKALLAADFAFLPVGLNDPRKSGAGANRLITALCLGIPVFTQSLKAYLPHSFYYVDIDSPGWENKLAFNEANLKLVIEYQSKIVPAFQLKNIASDWHLIFSNT
jgi:hypothetical protein